MSDGFLVSQIGHDVGESVRAIHRASVDSTVSDDAIVVAVGDGERRAPMVRWGMCWGAHWRVADLGPLPAGRWRLELHAGGTVRAVDEIEVASRRLFDATWRMVAIEQLERRTRIAHQGHGIGWQDAGCDWQEANSHGACIIGLADLLLTAGDRLDVADRERLSAQIRVGCKLLDRLQDAAAGGALVHELVRAPDRNLARDALWAALAWALAARAIGGAEGVAWSIRARQALAWWRMSRIETAGMDPVAHAWHPGYVPPAERPVGDLALAAWAAAELGEGDAASLADRVCALQIARDGEAPYGHFWQFSDRRHAACVWTHNGIGPDTGDTGMPVALCLAMVLKALPGHARAPRWREALAAWSDGWLEPGCAASPFGITPRLWKDGWVHFGGLWHGMNAAYGLASATADELAILLGRPRLRAIASGNRQWIAGLNAGITTGCRLGCHMTLPETVPGQALAASMITGVGRRWLSAWMAIPGTICNGFSIGDQFRFDVPADPASDGPHTFTDEDWITHAGGWLMAVART